MAKAKPLKNVCELDFEERATRDCATLERSLSPIKAIAVRSDFSEALVLALDVLDLARVDRIVGVLVVQQRDGQFI